MCNWQGSDEHVRGEAATYLVQEEDWTIIKPDVQCDIGTPQRAIPSRHSTVDMKHVRNLKSTPWQRKQAMIHVLHTHTSNYITQSQ